MELTKQIGKVVVFRGLLLSDYDTLKCFYSNFYPIEINHRHDNRTEFTCMSEYFDVIEEGCEVPKYEVFFEYISGELEIKEVIKLAELK